MNDAKSSKKVKSGTFRVLEVVNLLIAVRDSGITKHAEYMVLMHLILRCNPDLAFACWPKYKQLQLDTRLSPRKIKDAIAALKAMGFIRVKVRPNRSNYFFIEADKIKALAEAQKTAQKSAMKAKEDRAYGEDAATIRSIERGSKRFSPIEPEVPEYPTDADTDPEPGEESYEVDADFIKKFGPICPEMEDVSDLD